MRGANAEGFSKSRDGSFPDIDVDSKHSTDETWYVRRPAHGPLLLRHEQAAEQHLGATGLEHGTHCTYP